MAEKIHLEIVTPSKKVLSHACDDVYLPGSMGETGILPEHAAMVSILTTGAVRYDLDGEQRAVAVRNGFFQISENQLMILADKALEAEEIQPGALAKAREEVEVKFLSSEVGIEERLELEGERAWIEAQEESLGRTSTSSG